MAKTLYEQLGVSLTATLEDIKHAYQSQWQPLQNQVDTGDDAAKVRLYALRDAYATLSSLARRRAYDASLLGDSVGSDQHSAEPVIKCIPPRYDVALVAIPLFGAVIAAFAINPAIWFMAWLLLNLVTMVVIFATSYLAAREVAEKLTAEEDEDTDPALIWLVANTLLWAIAYPNYLWARKSASTSIGAYIGIGITVVFIGLTGWRAYQIDQAHRDAINAVERTLNSVEDKLRHLEDLGRRP